MKISKFTFLVGIIAILIFLIPFLWLRPGEMDLGGDSSRLYFYNPLAYLPNQSLYSVTISGMGQENLSFFGIPFFLFLAFLKSIFTSPTTLICIFHGLNLSLGFIFVYLIVREIFTKERNNSLKIIATEFGAIIAGLLYVFSPTEIYDWAYVILTHNQIFLNPLMFYLLLKFFTSGKMKYAYIGLIISFIFAPNFSFIGAPAIFSFYPVSFLFLFVYTRFVRKIAFPYKKTAIAFVLFLLLQGFHIIPQITTSFIPGGHLYSLVNSTTGKLDRGLGYFNGIVDSVKVSPDLMGLPPLTPLKSYAWLFFIIPFITFGAFLANKSKTFLLTYVIVFICLLFYAANITNAWVVIYKRLFYLPGFSMFRNFIGQWNYAYLFFLCLFFGQALGIILSVLKKKFLFGVIIVYIIVLLLFNAIPFINGSLVRKFDWTSKNVSSIVVMDPIFEKYLSIIKNLPIDGKVLFFPMNDHGYSAFAGLNGGVYAGPSAISYIAGKKDFTGYDQFEIFRDDFTTMVKNSDYAGIRHLLAVMNIKYLAYNADTRVYDDNFPNFPYGYMRGIMPDTQAGYRQFIKKLGLKEIINLKNTYYIYELDDSEYLPHIYIPQSIWLWNQNFVDSSYPLSLFPKNNKVAFYESTVLQIQPNATFTFADIMQLYPDKFLIQNTIKLLSIPFISQKLSSPIYPFIIWREQHSLRSFPTVSDAYIAQSIYYFEKRILELEKWEQEGGIPIKGNISSIDELSKAWKDFSPWKIYMNSPYNYWEVSLARYNNAVKLLIDKINIVDASSYPPLVYKTEINEILKADKAKLIGVIEGSQKTTREKIYLLHLVDDMYDNLNMYLNLEDVIPSPSGYSLGNVQRDQYIPLVYKDALQNFNASDITMRLDTTIIHPAAIQGNSHWINYDPITIDPNKTPQAFLSASNIINLTSEQIDKLENITQQGDTLQLHVDNTASDGTSGLAENINGWYPKTEYILSFDYNTHGKNFAVRVFENEGKKNTQVNIMDETIQSNSWKTFRRAVGLTAIDAHSAFLHITKTSDDLLARADGNTKNQLFEIKNLSVVQIVNPPLVFMHTVQPDYTDQTIPNIIFKKINPTKYVVHVSNVTKPYMLVLSDGFNNHWKVIDTSRFGTKPLSLFFRVMSFALRNTIGHFLPNPISTNIVVDKGAVSQLQMQNTFIDKNVFDTWGKKEIATKRHIIVNNYANGWYILPSDMNGEKDYTLTIEMTTQTNFYLSLLLSLITLVIIVLLLVFPKRRSV